MDGSSAVEWRPVLGFSNYSASSDGQIRGPARWGGPRNLSLQDSLIGYMTCALYREGKQYKRPVSRTVWEAFNGPIPPGMTIHHIDFDRANNRLSNMELLSHLDNVQKSNGRPRKPSVYLNPRDLEDAVARRMRGESIKSLADHFGVRWATMYLRMKKLCPRPT